MVARSVQERTLSVPRITILVAADHLHGPAALADAPGRS